MRLQFAMDGGQDPVMVRADRIRLKQALLNLVSNGVKFNSEGGRVSVRTVVETGMAHIEVRDSGIGMEADEIAQAFQPFVQLHAGHDRKYEGTGLGLPLTKMLVEAMKGSLTVQSQIGIGTCITINLPLAAPSLAARAA